MSLLKESCTYEYVRYCIFLIDNDGCMNGCDKGTIEIESNVRSEYMYFYG